jgi:hypothetical protein
VRALAPLSLAAAALLLAGCSFFTPRTEPEPEPTPEPDYSYEEIDAPEAVTAPGTQLAFDDPARLVSLSYEAELGFQLLKTETLDDQFFKDLPGRSDEWEGLVPVVVVYEYELQTGERYRNSELLTVRAGRITEIQVFFGGRVD